MSPLVSLAMAYLLAAMAFTLVLAMPVKALHNNLHEPYLTYTLGEHDDTSVTVYLVIENIADASALTNIVTVWDFGDGTNATLEGENKLGSDVNNVSHIFGYPGSYNVNVSLFINRYSTYGFQADFSLTLDLTTEDIRALDKAVGREAFVQGLRGAISAGLWLFAPMLFGLGLLARVFRADTAKMIFRFGWMIATGAMLSVFVAPNYVDGRLRFIESRLVPSLLLVALLPCYAAVGLRLRPKALTQKSGLSPWSKQITRCRLPTVRMAH